jgi:two-component system response regulator FixJ
MTDYAGQHIFFVDDEPSIRKVVARTLERLGSRVSCFARAVDCLERLRSKRCDLLITDVKMPGMDGIELLTEAKRIAPWLPVLVITGYGDVPMAVRALKAGALDFIEKPLNRKAFLAAVELALRSSAPPDRLLGSALSRAERRVLHLILDGKSNREIAELIHRSMRTVEVHRNRIMRKFGVSNVIGLVRRAAAFGLADLPADELGQKSSDNAQSLA